MPRRPVRSSRPAASARKRRALTRRRAGNPSLERVAGLSQNPAAVDPDDVKVGEVLSDAVSGYRALWRYLGLLSLALAGAVVLFCVLLVAAMGEVGAYASIILSLVGSFWVVALLVQTIDDLHEDGAAETSFVARLTRFWPSVNHVSGAALLLSLLYVPGWLLVASAHFVLGLLLVIVAVVASVWLVLAIPLIVIEGYGIEEAFFESKELVSGSALKVFGTLFVAGFGTGLLSNLVERIALAIGDSWVLTLIVSGVFNALVTTPLTALVLITLYKALREPSAAPATVAAAA